MTAATYAFTVPAPGTMFVAPTPTLNMITAQQFLDVCVTKDPVACLTGEMAVPMVRPQLGAVDDEGPNSRLRSRFRTNWPQREGRAHRGADRR